MTDSDSNKQIDKNFATQAIFDVCGFFILLILRWTKTDICTSEIGSSLGAGSNSKDFQRNWLCLVSRLQPVSLRTGHNLIMPWVLSAALFRAFNLLLRRQLESKRDVRNGKRYRFIVSHEPESHAES